jgi:hypothetical protein
VSLLTRFTDTGGVPSNNKMHGVETNLYRSGNNFWLQGKTDAQKIDDYGVKLRKMLNPRVVYTPFVRVNIDKP